jgi:hypothetical protein
VEGPGRTSHSRGNQTALWRDGSSYC